MTAAMRRRGDGGGVVAAMTVAMTAAPLRAAMTVAMTPAAMWRRVGLPFRGAARMVRG